MYIVDAGNNLQGYIHLAWGNYLGLYASMQPFNASYQFLASEAQAINYDDIATSWRVALTGTAIQYLVKLGGTWTLVGEYPVEAVPIGGTPPSPETLDLTNSSFYFALDVLGGPGAEGLDHIYDEISFAGPGIPNLNQPAEGTPTPSWQGMPGVPVAGAISLAVLIGAMALGGARFLKRGMRA
jgi:hypothetical protein